MLAHTLHIVIKGVIARPEDDSNALILGVAQNTIHINLWHNIKKIVLVLSSPALVKNHILNTILRCKVDICLVCSCVDTWLKVYIC